MRTIFLISISILLITIIDVKGQSELSALTDDIFILKNNAKEINNDTLINILELNVFNYYNLAQYDSELKRSIFMKTEEYEKLYQLLQERKKEILKTTFFKVQEGKFINTSYDLKLKGFLIELGSNLASRTNQTIDGVLFPSLPTKFYKRELFGPNILFECLLIKVNEQYGLEIEENKKDINIYYFYKPKSTKKTLVSYFYPSNGQYKIWKITNKDIESQSVRVIVANNVTGKIYYDYEYVVIPNKSTHKAK
jgi:hypothetical protein